MSKASGSKVALWVALGILGLIVLGGIALFVFVLMFMRSDQGQKFGDTISTLQRIERSAPEIAAGFENYIEANSGFPEELADVKTSMGPDAYKTCTDLFSYRMPQEGDPDTAVILWTRDLEMIMGGTVRVEILKDLSARQVQTMPLQSSGTRGAVKFE